MQIPYLREKLEFLLRSGRHPGIRTQNELAQRLGVSRSALSNWMNGSGGMAAQAMPDRHIRTLCELFALDVLQFLGDDPPDTFELRLQQPGGWSQLLKLAEINPQTLIIERDDDPSWGHRGVAQLGRTPRSDVMTLPSGSLFRLRLNVPAGAYVMLLLQDPHQIQYFDTKTLFNNDGGRAPQASFQLPERLQPPFHAEAPLGLHQWLLLVDTRAWPAVLLRSMREVQESVPDTLLRELAQEVRLRRAPNGERTTLWRCPFRISAAP